MDESDHLRELLYAAYAEIEELRNALEDCHKARSVLRDAMAVTPVKWDEDRQEDVCTQEK